PVKRRQIEFDQLFAFGSGLGAHVFDARTHAVVELLLGKRSAEVRGFSGVWVRSGTKKYKINLGRDGHGLSCQAPPACAINSHRRFAPRTHKTGFAASRVA